jgi:hypothetical protein
MEPFRILATPRVLKTSFPGGRGSPQVTAELTA